MEFLNWFIKEQAEEECSAQALITKAEFLGNDAKGFYLLDKELLAREYSAPDYSFD